MAEYIEREAVLRLLEEKYQDMSAMPASYYNGFQYALNMVKRIKPAADVIPKVAYEQVLWERDLALHQLKEHYGVGLGEKKADVVPVVYGRWKPEDNYFDGDTLGGRSEYYSQEDLNNDCITIYRRPPEGKKKK